jgi:hypothetical protein
VQQGSCSSAAQQVRRSSRDLSFFSSDILHSCFPATGSAVGGTMLRPVMGRSHSQALNAIATSDLCIFCERAKSCIARRYQCGDNLSVRFHIQIPFH